MKILVVDDEVMICDGTVKRILAMGLPFVTEVKGVYSGEEALKLLESEDFQLMFADIRMEGMDGLETIRRAHRLRPDMVCIILTAYGEFDYAQQAIRIGVHDYLVKPCSNQAMRDLIMKTEDAFVLPGRESGDLREEEWLEQITEYCRLHLQEPLDMKSVASHFSLSYSYFSKIFHDLAGQTFSSFMIDLRFQEVCRLLKSGMKIVDIAERLGYSNANNLTRAFTRAFGVSPSAWLKSQKGRD